MNTVNLVGRLTKDPEVRYSQGENSTAIARYTVAVDRKFKKENDATADFISCVSFGKTAEFLEKYFFKGMKIGVTGEIRTGSYTNKDGVKVYTTDIVGNDVEFVEKKGDTPAAETQANDSFINIPQGIEEELPFD